MLQVVHVGDCRIHMRRLRDEGVRFSACVTDPPYELNFMGKKWDNTGVAFDPETWRAVYDCLLPGAHLVAFGGTRTYHRMACAIEDAGFEIRDTLMWLYGSGFPKSHNVSVGIDKAAGAQRAVVGEPTYTRGRATQSYSDTRRVSYDYPPGPITAPATPEAAQWAGWGTALKPAVEPIILARKPLIGTVVATVLKHGTGALNIDASRVPITDEDFQKTNRTGEYSETTSGVVGFTNTIMRAPISREGRWPANVLTDGSQEVMEAFAAFGDRVSGELHPWHDAKASSNGSMSGGNYAGRVKSSFGGDSGTAARFFKSCEFTEEELRFHFCGKADAKDRAGSRHPTIKPASLMYWLVKLICPPGGTVLDPFAGSGSTLLAADQLGFSATGIEMDPTFAADARRKVAADAGMFAEIV